MLSLTAQLSKKFVALFGMLLVGALLVGTMIVPATADSLDDRLAAAQNKRSASAAQMEDLKDTLSETDEQLAVAYLQLKAAQNQLPVAEAALAVAQKNFDIAQREAKTLADKLQDARDQRIALETQIDDNDTAMTVARSGVVEMGRQAARGNMDMSGIGMIVGSESSDEFVERYNMNNTALRTQGSSLNRLRQTQAVSRNAQARLDGVNEAIETLKEQADEKLAESEEKRQVAEVAKTEVLTLIDQEAQAAQYIEGRKANAQAELAQEEQYSASLSDDIRKIQGIQEAERKQAAEEDRKRQEAERQKQEAERKKQEAANKNPANKPKPPAPVAPPVTPPATGGGSTGSGTSSGGNAGGSTGSNSNGWFAWPTAYRVVTSSYGWRLHPVLGYSRLHAGTDMRAYCGSPIYAGRAGNVEWAKPRGGFGNQILVNHGSIGSSSVMSSYNHLTSFAVGAGQSVKAGQLIGYAGNTGLSGACHLHFEVYVNGSTVDPMSKMK